MLPVGFGAIFFAAVIPHGLIEIPVTILATAAMFKLGAVVTKPPPGQTVGHAWITTLGSTLKITIGVIVPGLLFAALLEAYVTFPAAASRHAGDGRIILNHEAVLHLW